jgi:hypothetical protein
LQIWSAFFQILKQNSTISCGAQDLGIQTLLNYGGKMKLL